MTTKNQLIDQKVAIEAYSQGYTTFTNHDDDTKDEKLLSFFDSFIDLDHLKRSENSQIIQLESNFDRLEKISLEVEQKHDVEKHLSELNSKKDAYEKQNVGELMKLHSGLVEEEELRKQLETSLGGLSTKYKQVLSDKSDIDDLLQLDQTKVQVGKEHVDKVLEIVRDFSSIVDDHQKSLNSALEEKLILLRDEVKEWRKKEKNATEEIDKIKAKLDQDKIPYDESKFVLLSEDIAKYNKRKKEIEKSESDLSELKKERMNLLKGRKRILADIHNKRLAFCSRINKALAASVDGLFVNAKINEGYLAKDFSSFLKQEMGWHRWQNSDGIAEKYSPLDFYDLIKRKKLSNLSPLGLSAADIQDIEQRFTNLKAQQLLSITFEERPKLTVTHHDKISGHATTKDISELSLGQQQSIMLSILIQSDSSLPLIIDQPEDNLDSEFIFNSVVTNLRQCKEKRQVILVTHNSNIGVLGDAELVIPLVASNTKSAVVDSGSIDSSSTQHQCCQILEGGKRAFRTRKDIYGI
ncbi:hypothetical protein BCV12_000565 [Vibrio cyclitrophicus]|uniref:hypothetical protein n=1 Tax=Vibrio cyclitrophicus TaxID=47951 RepID=UPI0038B590B8